MEYKNAIFLSLVGMILFGFNACNTIPEGAVAVKSFDKKRYLGKWYEIARFDFRFERDLINTTAEYSLNEDGTIKVYNRGYNPIKDKWVDATGKAKFVGDETTAMLKVSFFGPFYAGYNLLAIDSAYTSALVAGQNLDYLWILSRDTFISDAVKNNYLKIAKDVGYNTDNLIWVQHTATR